MMRTGVRGSLLLLLVLAAGVALGDWYGRRGLVPPSPSPMEPTRMMHVFDRELGLDSAQHAAVAAVLARRQAAIDSAWRTLRPGVRAAVDSAQMEIFRVLRPDQQAKFMELLRTAHPASRSIADSMR